MKKKKTKYRNAFFLLSLKRTSAGSMKNKKNKRKNGKNKQDAYLDEDY